MKGKHI